MPSPRPQGSRVSIGATHAHEAEQSCKCCNGTQCRRCRRGCNAPRAFLKRPERGRLALLSPNSFRRQTGTLYNEPPTLLAAMVHRSRSPSLVISSVLTAKLFRARFRLLRRDIQTLWHCTTCRFRSPEYIALRSRPPKLPSVLTSTAASWRSRRCSMRNRTPSA